MSRSFFALSLRMWWRKRPKPKKPLREQLVEACSQVRHQIEIAKSPTNIAPLGGGLVDNRAVISELETELSQLEEALGRLKSDDT